MKRLEINGLEGTTLIVNDFSQFSDRETLVNLYWQFHPRFRFFKSVPRYSKLLDIGAGSGGLYYWKDWNEPIRNDIKMYAIDFKKGEFFDEYDDYLLCNLDHDKIKFGDIFFDAYFASHIVEHLRDKEKFFRNISERLKSGGKLYIEMPTPWTLKYPVRSKFLEKGVSVIISNFFDDKTHVETLGIKDMSEFLSRTGFDVIEAGIVENEFLEDELFRYGFIHKDTEITTYAVWLKLRWSQYIIAKRP